MSLSYSKPLTTLSLAETSEPTWHPRLWFGSGSPWLHLSKVQAGHILSESYSHLLKFARVLKNSSLSSKIQLKHRLSCKMFPKGCSLIRAIGSVSPQVHCSPLLALSKWHRPICLCSCLIYTWFTRKELSYPLWSPMSCTVIATKLIHVYWMKEVIHEWMPNMEESEDSQESYDWPVSLFIRLHVTEGWWQGGLVLIHLRQYKAFKINWTQNPMSKKEVCLECFEQDSLKLSEYERVIPKQPLCKAASWFLKAVSPWINTFV